MSCVIEPDTPYYRHIASSEWAEQLLHGHNFVRHVGRAGGIVDIVSADHSGLQASFCSSVAQVKVWVRQDRFSMKDEVIRADEANKTFPSSLHFLFCVLWLNNEHRPTKKVAVPRVKSLCIDDRLQSLGD